MKNQREKRRVLRIILIAHCCGILRRDKLSVFLLIYLKVLLALATTFEAHLSPTFLGVLTSDGKSAFLLIGLTAVNYLVVESPTEGF